MFSVRKLVRSEVQVDPREALFFFVGGKNIPCLSSTMEQLYEQYKDDDGFLYISYRAETVFG